MIARIIERVFDVGPQYTFENDWFPEIPNLRCWRCDSEPAADRVGLCEECRVLMRGDSTIPPGDKLLPHGTLPEEVP